MPRSLAPECRVYLDGLPKRVPVLFRECHEVRVILELREADIQVLGYDVYAEKSHLIAKVFIDEVTKSFCGNLPFLGLLLEILGAPVPILVVIIIQLVAEGNCESVLGTDGKLLVC